jgi:tRNA(fMet)-specific endonuclease VapC
VYLLDTNIAICLRDRLPEAIRRVAELGTLPRFSLLTWVELEGGVDRRHPSASNRRAAIDDMRRSFDFLPCDAPVVRAYARIIAAAGFSRRRIIDRLIAATAIVHDLTLITMNEADFRDIPDLRIEVWPDQ